MNSLGMDKAAGFSLIEMLVGLAIGLIIVAAATVMMVSTLKSQKEITATTKLNQEIGAVMSVISNEIRRSGYNVCDVANSDCDINGDGIEEGNINYNTSATNRDLQIFDLGGKGYRCILYRYNANTDNVDDSEERRGFRLVFDGNQRGLIQMADSNGDVSCENDNNWIALTDPNVINIVDLKFSSTGSKCLNVYDNISWAVGKVEDGVIVENSPIDNMQACEVSAGDTVVNFDETGNMSNVAFNESWKWKDGILDTEKRLFEARQVTIRLDAKLTRYPSILKKLQSSVKMENPRVENFYNPGA